MFKSFRSGSSRRTGIGLFRIPLLVEYFNIFVIVFLSTTSANPKARAQRLVGPEAPRAPEGVGRAGGQRKAGRRPVTYSPARGCDGGLRECARDAASESRAPARGRGLERKWVGEGGGEWMRQAGADAACDKDLDGGGVRPRRLFDRIASVMVAQPQLYHHDLQLETRETRARTLPWASSGHVITRQVSPPRPRSPMLTFATTKFSTGPGANG